MLASIERIDSIASIASIASFGTTRCLAALSDYPSYPLYLYFQFGLRAELLQQTLDPVLVCLCFCFVINGKRLYHQSKGQTYSDIFIISRELR